MSAIKKLAGQAALYGVSSIAGRFLNYLLVPFYTAVFAPEAYGIVTEVYAFVAFFNVIYAFGLETAYFRNAGLVKSDPTKVKSAYSEAVSMVLAISGGLGLAMCLGSSTLSTAMGYPHHPEYVWVMSLTMAIDGIATLPFAKLRLENRALRFVSIRLTGIVLNILFNFFFLWFCRICSEGSLGPFWADSVGQLYSPEDAVGYVFLSNLLANAVMLLLLLPELAQVRLRWPSGRTSYLLHYSYPLVLMGLTGMVNEMLGRLMLKSWLPVGYYPKLSNEAALGIYGAVYKLSIFMQLAIQAFRYAAEPFFFSKAADKEAPETFAKVMKWFFIACTFLYLAVSVNLFWIGPLVLKREIYLAGLTVVPILLLANLFLGVYYNLSAWFKIVDKTYFGTWLSAGGAVLTIVGNWLLIPIMGYMGSAVATLVCYASMTVACYVLGQKHYPVPYPIERMGIYLLLAIFLQSLNIWDHALAVGIHPMARVGWDCLLVISFLTVVWKFEGKDFKTSR